jgi:hypothetical protein
MKGFVRFNKIENSVELNVKTHRNIISPFANIDAISDQYSNSEMYVDENYGYVYDDFYIKGQTEIYGKEQLLPMYSGDQLANYGFLRVPFRKIPRVWVNSRDELTAIVNGIQSSDPNLVLLYRGQFQEYYIERDKETLRNLYGSESTLEPSLITSAVRKNLRLEDILPTWMGILNLYIENILNNMSNNARKLVQRKITNFQSSSNFNVFAMAMAQHYGLPSVGLDVSPDIDVALFFALRKFTATSTPFEYQYKDIKEVKPSNPSVIYLIAPTEHMQLNYFDFKPSIIPFLRPDKQAARFMHTGWGLSKNFAASRLFMAFYLNPDGDFGEIREPEDLFPTNDSFADLIDSIRISHTHKSEVLSKFLESFYMVRGPK